MTQQQSLITLCAFRYALGRQTYIVGMVVEYLQENWDEMYERDKNIIREEIKDAEKRGQLGDDCDKEDWFKLLDL